MTAKKTVILLVIIAILGLVAYWQFQQKPLQVKARAASLGSVETSVSNTRAGTIKACRRSKISMQTGGVVNRLLVKEGDSVKQGQLLLELWNSDRKADLAQSEQTYNALQYDAQSACLLADFKSREARRVARLAAKQLASEEDNDNAKTAAASQQQLCKAAKAQQAVAQARYDLQQALLERTQLRAPFAGIVAEINGEVGEYITPSPPGVATPPAVDLIDYSCLYVTAPIDEVDASRITLGLPARVTLDAFRDREFDGEVMRIAPYVLDLEKQARTVDVEVRLVDVPQDVSLLVGYSADISVILDRKDNVLRLPSEAILVGNRIWVISENGFLSRRAVDVGIGDWSFTEVTSGLEEGEQVVLSPDQPGIEEGAKAVAADD